MEVQVDEPNVVADPVERPTEPGRGAPQPGELAVRGVEDVRHDEQHDPDEVGPAVAVGEQVTGHDSDQDRPQRHLIGRDPRGIERPRDADPDGPEEPQIGPLLNRLPFMREVALRLHRAPPSGPRGPSSPGPRSEEHTSELQSQSNLVCRLLLEKKTTALPSYTSC